MNRYVCTCVTIIRQHRLLHKKGTKCVLKQKCLEKSLTNYCTIHNDNGKQLNKIGNNKMVECTDKEYLELLWHFYITFQFLGKVLR